MFEKILVRHILRGGGRQMAGPSVRIAIASVAICVAVMISSVAILQGFKNEIRSRIAGFAAHIKVGTFSDNTSAEPSPFTIDSLLIKQITRIKGIQRVQVVTYKTGLLRTKDQIQGLILKGGGSDMDTSFLSSYLVEGRLPRFSDTARAYELLISEKMASMLQIRTGEKATLYFVDNKENIPRARRFVITGIYDTGLEDFDQTMAFCNIGHLRRLNGWADNEAGLIEIFLDNEDRLEEATLEIYNMLPSHLNVSNMRENYPQIFDWLQLQDINVVVILVLMILVSVMAMSSALVILIVEKTRSIGILKALGATDKQIKKAFLLASAYIAGRSLLWGNVTALTLLSIQYRFHLLPLPRDSYYMDYVPVLLQVTPILLINLGTIVICVAAMMIPTQIIAGISPLKAIRFR
ncbi:MAG: ABC transporter permease [Bacteroidales bacterium]|nr:ABC transporter permease [Bacteroidales bacterium]